MIIFARTTNFKFAICHVFKCTFTFIIKMFGTFQVQNLFSFGSNSITVLIVVGRYYYVYRQYVTYLDLECQILALKLAEKFYVEKITIMTSSTRHNVRNFAFYFCEICLKVRRVGNVRSPWNFYAFMACAIVG